jgi:nicotinamide mononucleotide transporter
MRENSLCWYAAFGSTAIFSWLFFDVSLLMESALNVYYLVMAIYGWYVWNKKPQNSAMQNELTPKLPVTTWSSKQHALAIGSVLSMSFISGFLLSENTTAVMPYLDSFTTWGAVLTTYMVAKKVLENWIYWFVIDALAIYLYIDRELYLTSLLMAIYVVMVVFGYAAWLKIYKKQTENIDGQTT